MRYGKTLMLIIQCDSYFHSSLRPQMSSETNWGDGHGGEYWPVMVYHDRRHSWDAAMINDHNYEYIPIRHPKHLMHLAECIIHWPHYFCLILLHASPFSSSIERFVLFLVTVICNNFGLNRRWSMQKPFSMKNPKNKILMKIWWLENVQMWGGREDPLRAR